MTVFISYPSWEMSFVTLLHQSLKRRRISAFIAEWDVDYGKTLSQEIIDAMSSCELVFVIYTAEARTSPWVNQEIGWAVARNLEVVPVAEKREDLDAFLTGKKFIRFDRRKPEDTIKAILKRCGKAILK